MTRLFKPTLLALALGVLSIVGTGQLQAAPKKTTYYSSTKAPKTYKPKTYKKKAPYEGLGKKSERTGQIKTKPVRGHVKKTSKGYTYVNPYAKSKSPKK